MITIGNSQITLVLALLSPCGAQTAQTTPPSLAALIEAMQAKEKSIESASLEMTTKGSFPGGITITTKGKIRVLGKTHMHVVVHTKFGPEMYSETETLVTPAGVYTREKDPVQGEVFTHMDPELLDELRAASLVLGKDLELPGLATGPADGPLGSRVLEDLSAQFDLAVSGPVIVADESCWVVAGPARAGSAADQADALPADRMDLLVRRQDLAILRMTQLQAGRPISDVRITRIELNLPMTPESFKLEIEAKQKPIDVMDHPPMRDQIQRIFDEAKALGWTRK